MLTCTDWKYIISFLQMFGCSIWVVWTLLEVSRVSFFFIFIPRRWFHDILIYSLQFGGPSRIWWWRFSPHLLIFKHILIDSISFDMWIVMSISYLDSGYWRETGFCSLFLSNWNNSHYVLHVFKGFWRFWVDPIFPVETKGLEEL